MCSCLETLKSFRPVDFVFKHSSPSLVVVSSDRGNGCTAGGGSSGEEKTQEKEEG